MANSSTSLKTSDSALAMPSRPGLYRIDFANGKSYVGVSRANMRVRALNHFTDARRGLGTAVCNALRRHVAVFTPLVICADADSLSAMEANAIRVYGTRVPAGYNIEAGGLSPGPVPGFRRSDETRSRMSAARRGRHLTEAELLHLKRIPVVVEGRAFGSQSEAARELGMSRFGVAYRIKSPSFSEWSHG